MFKTLKRHVVFSTVVDEMLNYQPCELTGGKLTALYRLLLSFLKNCTFNDLVTFYNICLVCLLFHKDTG